MEKLVRDEIKALEKEIEEKISNFEDYSKTQGLDAEDKASALISTARELTELRANLTLLRKIESRHDRGN